MEVGGDAAQDLGEIRARAAAWIEDVDVVGGQAVGDAEVVLQGAVDAGDHVPHDLSRCVPDAELLAEVGVEGLQEGLVEVGDGLSLAEAVEKATRSTRSSAAAVQSRTSTSPGAGGVLGLRAAGRAP